MILPWILIAHVRSRKKRRNCRMLSVAVIAVTVSSFLLIATPLASGRSPVVIESGADLVQGGNVDYHFSVSDDEKPFSLDMINHSSSASGEQFDYWVEDIPWFGFAFENPLPFWDEDESAYSLDADPEISPLTGFFVMRYPTTGQLKPYLGIGSTLFIDHHGVERVDLFNQFVMGLSYKF